MKIFQIYSKTKTFLSVVVPQSISGKESFIADGSLDIKSIFVGVVIHCFTFGWNLYLCCRKACLALGENYNEINRKLYYEMIECAWCCLLCSFRPFLDLKVLSQRLQGMTIPSKWFASMWSFMFLPWPSFPQTLHRTANWCPLANLFWLFSIIDFTRSSSSTISPENLLGMANVPFSPGLWVLSLGICVWK